MKRLFDLILSFSGLIILSPLFLFISIFILLNDKGPILFKQKRVGKGGKKFVLYKFRSMRVLKAASDGTFEPGKNSRITSVGKVLRKTKLDELPQLFNVLIGNMSFVGPRPEVETWVRAFPERWEKILSVKPGITDNASLVFRFEEYILAKSPDPEKTYREKILPEKLKLYELYIDNHSLTGDFKLIVKTIIQIFKDKNYEHPIFQSSLSG